MAANDEYVIVTLIASPKETNDFRQEFALT